MQWRRIPCITRLTPTLTRYCIRFTSRLQFNTPCGAERRAPGLATPAAKHKAITWISQVGYRLVSTEQEVCQDSYSTIQVCVWVVWEREVNMCRCTWCVQVGLLVQFLASWHYSSDLCEVGLQLQPSSWRSDDLRTEQTERLVLPSLSPSFLPACLLQCVLTRGHAEVGQSALRHQAVWLCALL